MILLKVRKYVWNKVILVERLQKIHKIDRNLSASKLAAIDR